MSQKFQLCVAQRAQPRLPIAGGAKSLRNAHIPSFWGRVLAVHHGPRRSPVTSHEDPAIYPTFREVSNTSWPGLPPLCRKRAHSWPRSPSRGRDPGRGKGPRLCQPSDPESPLLTVLRDPPRYLCAGTILGVFTFKKRQTKVPTSQTPLLSAFPWLDVSLPARAGGHARCPHLRDRDNYLFPEC